MVLAVQREVLQARIGAVGNDQQRLSAGPVVQPETVGREHLAGIDAGAAEGADPLGILVVLVDEGLRWEAP